MDSLWYRRNSNKYQLRILPDPEFLWPLKVQIANLHSIHSNHFCHSHLLTNSPQPSSHQFTTAISSPIHRELALPSSPSIFFPKKHFKSRWDLYQKGICLSWILLPSSIRQFLSPDLLDHGSGNLFNQLLQKVFIYADVTPEIWKGENHRFIEFKKFIESVHIENTMTKV